MNTELLVGFGVISATVLLLWGLKYQRELRMYARACIGIVRMQARHRYVRAKSSYYWVYRNSLPRILRLLIDTLMRVNSTNALLDNPTRPSNGVEIKRAILQGEHHGTDVTSVLKKQLCKLDAPGALDKITFSASDVLPLEYMCAVDDPCVVDVTFRGYSNPAKRIPAKDYKVRYDLACGEVAQFPPYGVHERQRKGFGVRKIKKAEAQGTTDVTNSDVTKDALMWAGPRHNFYEDCEDGGVAKNFIDAQFNTLVTYSGGGCGEAPKMLLPVCSNGDDGDEVCCFAVRSGI